MCLLTDEPDAEWLEFLARTDAPPVYKYKRNTTTQYDPSTGLIEVELGIDDVAIALEACLDRMIESEQMGLQGRAGLQGRDYQKELDGCLSEIAFARAIKSDERPATGTFKAPDICGIQVRSTPYPTGRLVFRPNDNVADVFVLTTGGAAQWTIRGGIVGAGAKCAGTWESFHNRPGAWFVSQVWLKTLDKSDRFGHLFNDNKTPIPACP